ncbi:MAG: hypothetical protein WBX27_00415 [Specibacter sp.]
MRHLFRRWGRPGALRVDNGTPWGNWNDLPVALALWLVGLGVPVYWNDPGCPQQNAKVERSQGTGKRWAEPARCPDPETLQQQLDEADCIQRECYPAVGPLSRLAAFADLRHSGREYSRGWEERHWSLGEVTGYLQEFVVPRKVRVNGSVSVYEQDYRVGASYRGQIVLVQFDAGDRTWVICDAEGRQLRRHKSRAINRERVVKLRLELRHDP